MNWNADRRVNMISLSARTDYTHPFVDLCVGRWLVSGSGMIDD